MRLKPEDKAVIKIYGWLLENGFQPYLNERKNILKDTITYKVFKIKGSREKPDLVFYSQKQGGWIVLEIKPNYTTYTIRQSGNQLLRYYQNYTKNKTTYHINGESLNIAHFLLATSESPEGHVFPTEEVKNNLFTEKERKKNAVYNQNLPKLEYKKTHEFIRFLWQQWKTIGKDEKVGLGLLLSNSLDVDYDLFIEGTRIVKTIPKAFTQIHWKNRWNQQWIEL